MMEISEVADTIVFAGLLSPWICITLGIVALVALCILTRFELRTGHHLFAVVAMNALRLFVACLVLWMLAGPTRKTSTAFNDRKSVTVLVDKSASMRIIDPAATATQVRWLVDSRPGDASMTMKLLDALYALLASAAMDAERLVRSLSYTLDFETPTREIDRIANRVEESRIKFGIASEAWKPAQILQREIGDSLRREIPALLDDAKHSFKSGYIKALDDPKRALTSVSQELQKIAVRVRTMGDRFATEHFVSTENQDLSSEKTGETRAVHVTRVAEEMLRFLDGLPAKPQVTSMGFAESVVATDTFDAETDESVKTDLAAALRGANEKSVATRVHSIFLLTDGAHNMDSAPVDVASGDGFPPVYVLPIGNPVYVREVILHSVEAPTSVFHKDMIPVTAQIDAYGCSGESLRVELSRGDKVVDRKEVYVPNNTFLYKVRMRASADKLGRDHLAIAVIPLDDEKSAGNNSGSTDVNVIESDFRVLIADHFARWEHRYLRNLLKRDEHVEYDEVLMEPRLKSNPEEHTLAHLPKTYNGWTRYRSVILGDLSQEEISKENQKYLEQYVREQGSTLILIAGERGMPGAFGGSELAAMIPVSVDDTYEAHRRAFVPTLSSAGKAVDAMLLEASANDTERVWRDASRPSGFYGLSKYSVARPTSQVMMTASPVRSDLRVATVDPPSFICWHHYGRGKVVYLSAPVTHRLRYRSGDRYHHRFWGQLLRWALADTFGEGSGSVQIRTTDATYIEGEAVGVEVRLRTEAGQPVSGEKLECVVQRGDEFVMKASLRENEKTAGQYWTDIEGLLPGAYTVGPKGRIVNSLLKRERANISAAVPIVDFSILAQTGIEMEDTRCNKGLLEQIATASGGMVLPPTAIKEFLSELDLAPKQRSTIHFTPLWARWRYLWLIVLALTVEWVLRKLTGLA